MGARFWRSGVAFSDRIFVQFTDFGLYRYSTRENPLKPCIRAARHVLSRARVPYPPKKNRGAHQSKVLGVRGSISGPDSCTIRRIRLISILYQRKSSNSLVSVHNCQKSKEEIRTSSEKKTRMKNIHFSWRKLILTF